MFRVLVKWPDGCLILGSKLVAK